MSIDKTKLKFISKRKIDGEQVQIESVFPLQNVEKMLWVELDTQIESIEPKSKEVAVAGQGIFYATYIDTEKQIKTTEASAPFLIKIAMDEITENSYFTLTTNTIESEYVASSNKLQGVVAFSGSFVESNDVEFMCGGDENVCAKTEEFSCQELIKEENYTFSETLNYPITDKMNTILRVRSEVSIKSVIPDQNLFVISGEINTCVKYLVITDETQKIMTTNFLEPFKREIEVSGLSENGCVDVLTQVDRQNYKYEIDKEINKLVIDVPIKICYRAFDKTTVLTVVDVFSLTNELNITTSSFQKTTVFPSEFFENKIEGSVLLDDQVPRIDKIVGFSNASVVLTNTFFEEEKLYLEGVVSFTLVYLNDELGNLETTKQEIPFKVSIELENVGIDNLTVQSILTDIEVSARRGREIFIDGKLKTTIGTSVISNEALISDVENGELLPVNKSAIEIYFGKPGDDLWDIAKELRTNPDVISMQNPDIVLPLEQSENIIVYSPKNR